MIDFLKSIFMADKRTSTITRHELELGDDTRTFLERILSGPIDGTSINQKLDAVFKAINNLDRKVDEFMATQEERLRGVKAKLDAIQAGVDKIQQQLSDLKTNNPELEDEIAAIEATAAAIDTDVNPVAPEPEPTEPPA